MNRRVPAGFSLAFAVLLAVTMVNSSPPPQSDQVEIKQEYSSLTAQDKGRSRGALYVRADKQPKTAVVLMHPESDQTLDYRLVPLAKAGFAALGLAGRYTNDNAHLIMEELVLDLAAWIKYLKEKKGITHVVLLGHSGGGSLVAFYQNQAIKRPPNRIKQTPAGDPPNLNDYDLPKADGLIISAAHWGRGWAVLRKIDPSVVDEEDPLSVDPSLDMYNPANGFRIPPESSRYSEEFLKRFQAGKEERMRRLVEQAKGYVAEKKFYKKLMEQPDFKKRPLYEQIQIERRAIIQRYMVIYRVMAIPKYTDLSIDPSDRLVGSNVTFRPDLGNYSEYFHPNAITPEAFLSAESTASNVRLLENLAEITEPTLVICGTADRSEYPSEQKAIFEAAATKDKKLVWIEGADHGYNPSGPKAGKGNQREQMLTAVIQWLNERFPN